MKTVYAFFADGMEEVEALMVIDLLRRTKELNVVTVSIKDDLLVESSHNIKLFADKNIDEINNYLKKSTDYKIKLDIEYNEYMIITLKSSIDLITPGLKKILNNPYVINVERSIIYE